MMAWCFCAYFIVDDLLFFVHVFTHVGPWLIATVTYDIRMLVQVQRIRIGWEWLVQIVQSPQCEKYAKMRMRMTQILL